MTGKFSGNTPFGERLNRIVSKVDHLEAGRFKAIRAILDKSFKGNYAFTTKLLDDRGNVVGRTGPIPIIGTEDQLAMMYGSPENMTSSQTEPWEVMIFYTGPTASKGIALVTRRLQEIEGGRFEAVTLSNELLAKGTAYAPPGSGLV